MKPTQIEFVHLNLLDPDEANSPDRVNSQAIERLAETIRIHGIQQPLRVRRCRNGRFKIICGHRRCKGARVAGLEFVPCIIEEEEATDSNLLLRRLLENTAREDLNPMDLSDSLEQAVSRYGLTAAELARQVGLSASHVSKLRGLQNAAPEVQDAVRMGELPASSAYELLKLNGKDAQRKAAAFAMSEKLSRENLARKIRRGQRVARDSRCKVTLRVAVDCSVAVVGKELSMASLVEWLAKLADKARLAQSQGLSVESFSKSLRPAKPIAKAGAA